MKKLILITVFCLTAIACFSQQRPKEKTLLDSYVFDGDTTIYVQLGYDYRFILQATATGLTGTTDGIIKIKRKIKGMTDLFYAEDSTNSCFSVNSANFNEGYTGLNTLGDTLRIDLVKNNITGGTITLKIKLFSQL